MQSSSIRRVEPLLIDKYLFVEIETDDGLVGLGEAGAWAHIEATTAAIEKFGHYLIGKDADHITRHWDTLHRFGSYDGTVIMAAISAIDIALWDLKGKRLQQPVFSLLGGPMREKVRVYGQARGNSADDLIQSCLALRDAGYTAIGHINPFLDEAGKPFCSSFARAMEEATSLVFAIRRAVGLDVDLCIDVHRRLNPAQAIAFGYAIRDAHPLFYEDPIRPDSIDAMTRVQANVPVPVATGERVYSLDDFRQLCMSRAASYLRPCMGLCGGFTGAMRVAALAQAFDITIIPHNTFSPVATMASLHLCVALPNLLICEYPTSLYLDGVSSTELVGRDLVTSVPRLDAGYAPVPIGPGLGVGLSEKARSHCPKRNIDIAMRRHVDGSNVEH
ncbi:mandelate racemase/muconate lactonizing enzyme family protein [Mesorhizobium sp.]|uniref:mandelate racemase/muconate lactonizing enzyme family protein n=1 Tax=Mesorhizobium sp. TaxID=1871066 RepID=UPI0025BE51D2|nr:mandelate racemase/muconate lactonizing enzyme family protein [Mesorhizobium sp.]